MNELNKAKENYKQRNGIKKISIKPILLRGTTIESKNLFLVNGKKMILIKGKIPDFTER